MTATKSYANLMRGERVDQPDMQHVAEVGHRDALVQLFEQLIIGVDGSPCVISGFQAVANGAVITVQQGGGLVGFRDRGALYLASLASGGAASKAQNVSTLPDGNYGVYLKLDFRKRRFLNRRFWNQPGTNEIVRNIATRVAEDWSMVFERSSPGPEYALLATFTLTGGVISVFTEARSLMFEGSRSAGQNGLTDADWGGGNDRVQGLRDVDGIKSFRRWILAVERQLQDIIGSRWFANPQSGSSNGGTAPRALQQLNDEKLARNGGNVIAGTLRLFGTNLYDLGELTVRLRTLYSIGVDLLGNITSQAVGYQSFFLSGGASGPNTGRLDNTPNAGPGGSTALVQVHAGSGDQGRAELVGAQAALRGSAANFLAPNCQGQNGLFYFRNLTFNFPSAGHATKTTVSVAVTPPVGVTITPTDFVIGTTFLQSTPNSPMIDVFSVYIDANNSITCMVLNCSDSINLVNPFTVIIDILVMKAAPLTP